MYRTRDDRGDDHGESSHYRPTEPPFRSSGGSRVSRGREGRAVRRGGRDEEPPVREWLQEPPRGWGDEDDPPEYGLGSWRRGRRRRTESGYDPPGGGYDPGGGRASNTGYDAVTGYQPVVGHESATGYDPATGYDTATGYDPVTGYDSTVGYEATDRTGEYRTTGRRARRLGPDEYQTGTYPRGFGELDDDTSVGYYGLTAATGAVERYVPPRYHGDELVEGYRTSGSADEYPGRRRAGGDTGGDYVPRRAANEPADDQGEEPRRSSDARSGSPDQPRRSGRSRRAAGASEDERERADTSGSRRPPGGPGKAKRKRKQMPLWQEMPLLLIVAFCLAVLIRTFLVQAFYIPSGSMTDTLLIGDRVLVNKVVYDMRDPRRGEIVVFSGTDSWVPEVPDEPNLGFMAKLGRTVGDLVGVSRPGDKDFIKRVIGLPGDRVSCCDAQGRVQVNGQPLDEPYVIENSPLDVPPNPGECRSRRFNEITIEPGYIFVMGDHRLVSQDARCQGPVPIKNVIGKAFVVVWPKKSWATLPTPSTFEDVPPPTGVAIARDARTVPVHTAPTGIFGIVLPILLPLAFSARTGRKLLGDRRRLAE